jgi:uncharacterized RDD family membrane protein YckC
VPPPYGDPYQPTPYAGQGMNYQAAPGAATYSQPVPYPPLYPRQPYPGVGAAQPLYLPPAPSPYAVAPSPYGPVAPYAYPQPAGQSSYALTPIQDGPGSVATTLPRFGAYLFDLVVYGVTAIVLLALAGALGIGGLGVLLAMALHPLYYIGFWASSGQTPGYRAAGLQLIKTDGTRPGVGAATVRYVGWHISKLAFYLGCLWMIWDYQKQTWHDKMANTLVIRA